MRRKVKWWFETDVHSRWGRRYLIWVSRTGARKKVKKLTNQRERREGKQEVLDRLDEWKAELGERDDRWRD